MLSRLIFIILGLSTALVAAPPFESEPLVRVRIIHTMDTLNIQMDGSWKLKSGEDESLILPDSTILRVVYSNAKALLPGLTDQEFDHIMLSATADTAQVQIEDVPYGVGWWWGGQEDRLYDGTIHIYPNEDNHLSVTVHLPMEEYLKGVVPYEIGGDSPAEALKAQAVAARSEAVIALNSGFYGGSSHDLTSDVECQVFSGNHRRTTASDDAVEATRGLVISEHGAVIHAFYSSNCGGRSSLIKNVWASRTRSESYQQSLPDNASRRGPKLHWNWRAKWWIKSSPKVYCNPFYQSSLPSWSQRNFRWSREFTILEISAMITEDETLGYLRKIKALKRGESGKIIKAQFIFENGSFEKEGELTIRQLFSPSLRSSNFYVKKKGDTITLHGAGWGHGVGMCQSGAVAQASNGITFDRILSHYYPASILLDIYK